MHSLSLYRFGYKTKLLFIPVKDRTLYLPGMTQGTATAPSGCLIYNFLQNCYNIKIRILCEDTVSQPFKNITHIIELSLNNIIILNNLLCRYWPDEKLCLETRVAI